MKILALSGSPPPKASQRWIAGNPGSADYTLAISGNGPSTLRYMGTKRVLAPVVRASLDDLPVRGPVLDLFSGMGSVASALAPRYPVTTNDLLSFTTVFARCRFTASRRGNRDDLLRAILPRFRRHHSDLTTRYRRRLNREADAVAGGRQELEAWYTAAPHVGSSDHYRREAAAAANSKSADRYRLATLYFGTGYFSTGQAIEIDALRYAIDRANLDSDVRDWALAAWLLAAGRVLSAPGHTAQFLRPVSVEGFERIRRIWRRSLWPLFISALDQLGPLGTAKWRGGNKVENMEALELLRSLESRTVGAVYADPPYTKDQYSRYYHVYETLYRYDFPDSVGRARARSDRFSTEFSLASGVEDAVSELIRLTAALDRPLVLSYPADGLLSTRGVAVEDVIRQHRTLRRVIEVEHRHSTMGASKGSKHKETTERIYVCV